MQVEKDTPTGTVIEKVHLTYTQAWNAYNEAQKAEIKLLVDRAYRYMKRYSVPSRKSILSYPADVRTASSRTRPNAGKSTTLLISIHRPRSSIILR
ncbi:MAG: hypothetical protein NTY37_06815 [Methanothrix sp.]|nr:hypothetical protein [Methanothrix sp.]